MNHNYYKRARSILRPDVLQNKRVAVVGCGSGGGRAATEFGRLGVPLLLIDRPGECLEEHNILRHELGYHSLDKPKTTELANHIRNYNPDAQISAKPVCQTTVTLSARPATLDLPFSLADTSLADHPGNYEIELHLESREIAKIPFRIVSEAEIIQQIQVTSFEMAAVPRHGVAPVRCNQLSFGEHRELRIAFAVRAGLPAPGFALPGRVEVIAGQRVLFSSDFLLPLDQETIGRELKPLPAAALWATAGQHDQTLHVQISVAGALKYCHPLKLQIRTRLTNFEGALRQDAHALEDVDEEYRAILHELGR
jgi:hypothetical protein